MKKKSIVYRVVSIVFNKCKRITRYPWLNTCTILYLSLITYHLSLSSCSSSKHSGESPKTAKGRSLNDENNNKFKAFYYDGTKQKILGNYDDALGFFKRCLVIDPANAAANYDVAEIMDSKKKPDSALFYAERAVKYEPSNVWFEEFYAQCLQQTGKIKEAPEVYKNIIKMQPNNTDYYYKLALSQLQAGEYKEALETYNLLEKKLGVINEEVSMSKTEIYEKLKDYAKAEEEIEKLIKHDPNTPQYYDMLGNLYELEGKKDKAFEEYQEMEKIHPDDPMVHLSLADYYQDNHEDQKAYQEIREAIEQPTLDIDTKLRIIKSLSSFSSDDSLLDRALDLAGLMVKANPSEAIAHAIYAEFLKNKKRITEARDQYRMAVNLDSNKSDYWNSLLNFESDLNDFPDLASESKIAIGLFPTNPQLYIYNGFANIQLKKYEEALNSLNEGVQYALADSIMLEEFYSELGNANHDAGHYTASDSDYEIALKINPNNDNVLNNYSYYLSERDTNLARAEAMSKKSNELMHDNPTYEDTYCWILYMEGKYKEAKDWEDKAISQGGDNDPTIIEHYGDILYKSGEKDKALEYWIKAKDKGANSDLLDRKIRDKKLYDK